MLLEFRPHSSTTISRFQVVIREQAGINPDYLQMWSS